MAKKQTKIKDILVRKKAKIVIDELHYIDVIRTKHKTLKYRYKLYLCNRKDDSTICDLQRFVNYIDEFPRDSATVETVKKTGALALKRIYFNKYFIKLTHKSDNTCEIQSKWFNLAKEATNWYRLNLDYVSDNIRVEIITAPYDAVNDTYGDYKLHDTIQ